MNPQMRGVTPDKMRIGLPVQVTFERATEGSTLPAFVRTQWALYKRRETGEGHRLQVAMQDAGSWVNSYLWTGGSTNVAIGWPVSTI